MNQNYQKQLDALLGHLPAEKRPHLLLHGCCAPCSSYVLEYLSQYFAVTLYYYNPNITPRSEYDHRLTELKRLLAEMPLPADVSLLPAPYDPARFAQIAHGLEQEPEGGSRCRACYALRLEQTAAAAKAGGFDYYCTTLSISPLKNAGWLNELGQKYAMRYGVPFLPSDFKKREGYKRSIALSRQYGLYRQDYCGCGYSKAARERQKADAGRT